MGGANTGGAGDRALLVNNRGISNSWDFAAFLETFLTDGETDLASWLLGLCVDFSACDETVVRGEGLGGGLGTLSGLFHGRVDL